MQRSSRSLKSSIVKRKESAASIVSTGGSSSVDYEEKGKYESRCKLLEQELNLCIAAGERAEEAHVKGIEKLEEQTNRSINEQRILITRFQQNGILDDAIKNLYIQMKVTLVGYALDKMRVFQASDPDKQRRSNTQ